MRVGRLPTAVQIAVNGYNVGNDNDLADTVVYRNNEMLNVGSRMWDK